MKEIENPSIPSHPLLHRHPRLKREGRNFARKNSSLFGKMVQGLAAFKDLARGKNRAFAQRADVEDIRLPCSITTVRSSILSDLEREREREREPGTSSCLSYTPRSSSRKRGDPPPRIHRDLTRCAPPDPYLRRGLPRASAPRVSPPISPPSFGGTVFSKREVETLGERRRWGLRWRSQLLALHAFDDIHLLSSSARN